MSLIQSHRDLVVWNKSMDLAVIAYELVRSFPTQERFGLTSQLTRATISVPANIAEGHARAGSREYAQFVSIARGSLMEAETYVMIAVRLGYIAPQAAERALSLITEISKMLTTLRSRLLSKE